jgi:hypothetical protein
MSDSKGIAKPALQSGIKARFSRITGRSGFGDLTPDCKSNSREWKKLRIVRRGIDKLVEFLPY